MIGRLSLFPMRSSLAIMIHFDYTSFARLICGDRRHIRRKGRAVANVILMFFEASAVPSGPMCLSAWPGNCWIGGFAVTGLGDSPKLFFPDALPTSAPLPLN